MYKNIDKVITLINSHETKLERKLAGEIHLNKEIIGTILQS